MNVAIVEDHKVIAEALKNTLENFPPIKSIRVFFNGDSLLDDSGDWVPDLVISDILMPGTHGVELVKAYKKKLGKNTRIIILSSVTNTVMIQSITKLGVKGYLSKQGSLEELKLAINKVMAGEMYVGSLLKDEFAAYEPVSEKMNYHLSPREKDVLILVCSGSIIKEVAEKLNLSVHTVQSYHKNIMRKFNVRRTPDLVREAIKHGFYNPNTKS